MQVPCRPVSHQPKQVSAFWGLKRAEYSFGAAAGAGKALQGPLWDLATSVAMQATVQLQHLKQAVAYWGALFWMSAAAGRQSVQCSVVWQRI